MVAGYFRIQLLSICLYASPSGVRERQSDHRASLMLYDRCKRWAATWKVRPYANGIVTCRRPPFDLSLVIRLMMMR